VGAIAGPIGSVGDVLDNALMESAVELDNSEVIDKHSIFNGRAELKREIAGCAVHTAASGRTRPALHDRTAV
jgi:putative transposase